MGSAELSKGQGRYFANSTLPGLRLIASHVNPWSGLGGQRVRVPSIRQPSIKFTDTSTPKPPVLTLPFVCDSNTCRHALSKILFTNYPPLRNYLRPEPLLPYRNDARPCFQLCMCLKTLRCTSGLAPQRSLALPKGPKEFNSPDNTRSLMLFWISLHAPTRYRYVHASR